MKTKLLIAAVAVAVTGSAVAWIKCPPCNGTGWQGNLKCFSCGGDGKIGQ